MYADHRRVPEPDFEIIVEEADGTEGRMLMSEAIKQGLIRHHSVIRDLRDPSLAGDPE
jgi:hypothetical protein